MEMVRLEGVSKRYDEVMALSVVNLSVEKGEFVTLLGPSGSGKTTLLNIIAGMAAPTAGQVYIDGVNATEIPPKKRNLGMVFQDYALMPHMTIFENIAFPLRVRRVAGREIARKVSEVLGLVQLPDVADRRPRELSGGQQQRVALARCLVYDPSLILMDEPLAALDKKLREQMQLELKRIHTELGITVLYVTHDQQEALTMSDRIVLLDDGRIEQMGEPDHMYFNPNSVFSANFLGDSNMMEAIVERIGAETGVMTSQGHTFQTSRPTVAEVGGTVKLMIRPENIRIVRQNDDEEFENEIDGKVVDSVILGGVIRHHIDVGMDEMFVSQELNRSGRASIHPGTDVVLGWRAEDMYVLPLQGTLEDG